jgi:hypothetical protein
MYCFNPSHHDHHSTSNDKSALSNSSISVHFFFRFLHQTVPQKILPFCEPGLTKLARFLLYFELSFDQTTQNENDAIMILIQTINDIPFYG